MRVDASQNVSGRSKTRESCNCINSHPRVTRDELVSDVKKIDMCFERVQITKNPAGRVLKYILNKLNAWFLLELKREF